MSSMLAAGKNADLLHAEGEFLAACGWKCVVIAPGVARWRDPEDKEKKYFYHQHVALLVAKERVQQ